MHVVFRRDKDVSSKNPAGGVNPARLARRARRQGVLSLGYFSLHEQREVTRSCEAGAKARPSSFRFHTCPKPIELLGYHLGLRSCRFEKASKGWSRIKSFRSPSGREPPFFARAKKGGPKKHAPASAPSVPSALRVHSAGRIFRRDILVSSKNDVHPCTSPFGLFPPAPSLRKGTLKVKSNEQQPKPKQALSPSPAAESPAPARHTAHGRNR